MTPAAGDQVQDRRFVDEDFGGAALAGVRAAATFVHGNLEFADLEGADLTGADRFQVVVDGARLAGAHLRGRESAERFRHPLFATG